MKRWLTIGIIVLVMAFAVLVVSQIGGGKPTPQAPLPNPNGYDDFARAAQRTISWTKSLRDLTPGQLREIVQQNSQVLADVREGLKKPSVVPVTNDMRWITWHMPQLSAHRSLAMLLTAEGIVALDEKRTNDAARCFTECITFSHAVNFHGLMINDMVASACQAIGTERLGPIAPGISNDVCREILQNLLSVDQAREPAANILKRDREWSRGAYGSIKSMWSRLISRKSIQTLETKFVVRHDQSTAALRWTITDLAVRGYMAEHDGKPPQKLEDLVPNWLSAVPIDPISNKPFIYQPGSNSFSLSGAPLEGGKSRAKE